MSFLTGKYFKKTNLPTAEADMNSFGGASDLAIALASFVVVSILKIIELMSWFAGRNTKRYNYSDLGIATVLWKYFELLLLYNLATALTLPANKK